MRTSEFVLPFLLSAAIHVGAVSSQLLYRDAKVAFERGHCAVTLNLVPSVAQTAPGIVPVVDVADPPKADPVSEAPQDMAPPEPKPNRELSPTESARAPEDAPPPPYEPSARPQQETPVEMTEQEAARTETFLPEPEPKNPEEAQQAFAQTPSADNSEPKQQNALDPHETQSSDATPVNSNSSNGDLREQGVTAPVVLADLSKPEYPRFSRIRGEEGTVVLSVEVLPHGQSGKIEVVTSSGYRRLDRAAVDAVEKAAFTPAKVGGHPVQATKRITFRFDLDD